MKDIRTVAQKKQEFLDVFKNSMALKTLACRKIKIGRTMLYEYLASDVEFALQVQEIEEAMVDYAESKLIEKMHQGNLTALICYMNAKGRGRGYRYTYK